MNFDWAGLATGLGSLSDSVLGWFNFGQQTDNLNWQKGKLRESWAREDTAIQRRAMDLKAAGLNPVLAAGQGAQSSGPISTTAPQAPTNNAEKIMLALQAMKMKHDISLTNAQRDLAKQQQKKVDMETLTEGERAFGQVLQNDRSALDYEERKYNYDHAKTLNQRSDITTGLNTQLQGLYNLFTHNRAPAVVREASNLVVEKITAEFPNISTAEVQKAMNQYADTGWKGIVATMSPAAAALMYANEVIKLLGKERVISEGGGPR